MKMFKEFLFESIRKGDKKYFDMSFVLKWYSENKEKLSKILDCDVSDLISEEELLNQSRGLVNDVINIQSGGFRRRNNIEGFKEFEELEKILIHDILHNLYDVSEKEFNKSLTDIEYEETELVEEIEILSIEETFMKNMNIKYLKSDFINQNINQLVSYLMMAILKNDYKRVFDILDGKTEPYLVIDGEKYYTKDTPFDKIFELYKNNRSDEGFNINSSNDLLTYLNKLYNDSLNIDNYSGDRAEYPEGSYIDITQLSEDDLKELINYQGVLDYDRNGVKVKYLMYTEDDDIEDMERDINFKKFSYDDESDTYVNGDETLDDLGFALGDEFINEVPIQDIDYLELDVYNLDTFNFNSCKALVVKKTIIENSDKFETRYEFLTPQYFYEYLYHELEIYILSKDYEDYHEDYDLGEFMKMVFRNDTFTSIMRRNFRVNDVVVNNTKLDKTSGINKVDKSEISSNISVSKNILTKKGKRLQFILNTLKGNFIKNIDNIKKEYNDTKDVRDFLDKNLDDLNKIILNTTEDFNYGRLRGNKKLLNTLKDNIDNFKYLITICENYPNIINQYVNTKYLTLNNIKNLKEKILDKIDTFFEEDK